METTNQPMQTPPDNNLIWAILCTVFCCLPLGIVSIISASKVNERWAQGDYDGAYRAADDAKKWAIWGAASSLILVVLYVIFVVIIGIGGNFAGF
ncbi:MULTISPECIES: CD225/dispanin family protein [Aequorivita]|uniref:CD225/dispanin family protein n=2 Tax=Aequorivita TaxID=153265 RepID=A0AB35YT61_9FLAO|nr:CD225/dispanin family protein [Aequorivita sp. Ant34-E75]WGF93363.1 CD225/dispanin family protein [Aequorivita sp. Ant34-E75]